MAKSRRKTRNQPVGKKGKPNPGQRLRDPLTHRRIWVPATPTK